MQCRGSTWHTRGKGFRVETVGGYKGQYSTNIRGRGLPSTVDPDVSVESKYRREYLKRNGSGVSLTP